MTRSRADDRGERDREEHARLAHGRDGRGGRALERGERQQVGGDHPDARAAPTRGVDAAARGRASASQTSRGRDQHAA